MAEVTKGKVSEKSVIKVNESYAQIYQKLCIAVNSSKKSPFGDFQALIRGQFCTENLERTCCVGVYIQYMPLLWPKVQFSVVLH